MQVWHSEDEDAQSDCLRKKAVKVKHVKRREKKPEKKVRSLSFWTADDVTDDVTNTPVLPRRSLSRLLKRRRSLGVTKRSSVTGSACGTVSEEERAGLRRWAEL